MWVFWIPSGHRWDDLRKNALATDNPGERSLLPFRHGLTAENVRARSPPPGDQVALSTAQFSMGDIADQIAEVVRGEAEAS